MKKLTCIFFFFIAVFFLASCKKCEELPSPKVAFQKNAYLQTKEGNLNSALIIAYNGGEHKVFEEDYFGRKKKVFQGNLFEEVDKIFVNGDLKIDINKDSLFAEYKGKKYSGIFTGSYPQPEYSLRIVDEYITECQIQDVGSINPHGIGLKRGVLRMYNWSILSGASVAEFDTQIDENWNIKSTLRGEIIAVALLTSVDSRLLETNLVSYKLVPVAISDDIEWKMKYIYCTNTLRAFPNNHIGWFDYEDIYLKRK